MVRCYVKSKPSRLKLILRLASSAHYISLCGLVLFHVGMDAGTSAGLSLPLAAAQRKPFADQLADASAYSTTSISKLKGKRLTRLLFPSQSKLPNLGSSRTYVHSQRLSLRPCLDLLNKGSAKRRSSSARRSLLLFSLHAIPKSILARSMCPSRPRVLHSHS